MSAPKIRQLDGLTSLRFFAAMLVVLFHYTQTIHNRAPGFINDAVDLGYTGVSFFFILSGFILAYNYAQADFASPDVVRKFFRARFARIYPLYALSIAWGLIPFLASVFKISHPLLKTLKLYDLVLAPLALQAWVPGAAGAINGPIWAVSTEVFFYLLFPLLLRPVLQSPGRWLCITLLYWLAVTAVACRLWDTVVPATTSLVIPIPPVPPVVEVIKEFIKFFPPFRLAEFVSGILLYHCWQKRREEIHALPLLMLAIIFYAALVEAAPLLPEPLVHNGLFALAWLPLVFVGAQSTSALLSSRALVFLGKISYALYLFHWPWLLYMQAVNKKFFANALPPVNVALLSFAFALASSVAAYLLVEEPMRRLLMGRSARVGDSGPRKLAIYLPTLASGGAERLHISLAPALKERGMEVTLLVNQLTGAFADAVPEDIELVSLRARRSLSAFFPLIAFLKKHKPDILLSNLEHTNAIAILAVLLSGAPTRVIVTQHNTYSIECSQSHNWKYRILPFFYPSLLRRADGIVAVSKGVAGDLAQSANIPADRITAIYNPIVSDDFDARMREASSHPWLAEKIPFFIGVGRLVPQKNFSLLITAFAEVAAQHPCRLILIGEGPLREELLKQAVVPGIADRVNLPGFVKNPLPFMRHAAALVMSSNYEGFGNVLVEALACGTPVISTNCPYGPAEILEGGKFGVLVPVGDAEAMARAMLQALVNPKEEGSLRAHAQEFRVARTADKYMQLFDKVLAGKDAA